MSSIMVKFLQSPTLRCSVLNVFLNDKDQLNKFDFKNQNDIFLGYSLNSSSPHIEYIT